jgi:hypothetical protein
MVDVLVDVDRKLSAPVVDLDHVALDNALSLTCKGDWVDSVGAFAVDTAAVLPAGIDDAIGAWQSVCGPVGWTGLRQSSSAVDA